MIAYKNEIFNPLLEQFCSELSNTVVDVYRNNKETTEDERKVIRQTLSLIAHQADITYIREQVKREFNASQLKRSQYKEQFDHITDFLSLADIVSIADSQCDYLIRTSTSEKAIAAVHKVKVALEIFI